MSEKDDSKEGTSPSISTDSTWITCDSISNRRGYIEVSANIHPSHVTLEATEIHTGIENSGLSLEELESRHLSGEVVHSVCELELTLDQAMEFSNAILSAVEKATQELT